jgi:tRNA pseudouridine13 synthase
MKIKYRPEDFVVRESWRFDDVPGGGYFVYAMDKQKLGTLDAVERICQKTALPRSSISFCGLKDKQGRTEQLVAVKGKAIEIQDPDLRLRPLGETNRPLSARNTTSNRFAVTVRDLGPSDVERLPESVAEVQRLGVINYFDSQRFGHLKHGQGFIAKDILKGQWEHALHNYLAQPSPLDRTDDAKVKAFWRDHWGDWSARSGIPAASRYHSILTKLRENPKDFKGALLTLEPRHRALILFTYQSFLWNEGVKLLLLKLVGQPSLCQVPYQAGMLLFPRAAPAKAVDMLRHGSFPLLGPELKTEPGPITDAINEVLRREKLTLAGLRIPDAPIFFKAEPRQIAIIPGKLVVSRAESDPLFRGRLQIRLAFTLPPGSYATLVVRRLFWYALEGTRAAKEPDVVPEPPRIVRDPRTTGFLAKKRARQAARAARPPPAEPRTAVSRKTFRRKPRTR